MTSHIPSKVLWLLPKLNGWLMSDSPQLKCLQWWWGNPSKRQSCFGHGYVGNDVARYQCSEVDTLDLYLNIVFVYIDCYYIDF